MARRAGDSAEVLSLVQLSVGSRRLTELYQPPVSDQHAYHQGTVLSGDIPMSILWYGRFTPAQRSIISDFLHSLTAAPNAATPSVGEWWGIIEQLYLSNAATNGPAATHVLLAEQVSDEQCSLGRSLTLDQIDQLAARVGRKMGGVALVFTDEDVTVEGFCSSRCGTHGSTPGADSISTHTSGSATPSSSARGRSRSRCTGRRARPWWRPTATSGWTAW